MLFASGIGIDISDHHIRLAWLNHAGEINALHEAVLPLGLVVDDKIVKTELLKNQLQILLEDKNLSGLKGNMTILVPESRVLSGRFVLPAGMKHDEREEKARSLGQAAIPLPFDKAFVDMEFGHPIKERVSVGVYAAEKEMVRQLEGAFELFERPIVAFESSSRALYRLLTNKYELEGLTVIVDIGIRWANISLYDQAGSLILSRSAVMHGQEDPHDAKKRSKLSSEQIASLCAILHETIDFIGIPKAGKIGVYLSGSGAGGKEVVTTCHSHLPNMSFEPIAQLISFDEVSAEQVQAFGPAIGAAMRSIKPRNYHSHHNFKGVLSYEA